MAYVLLTSTTLLFTIQTLCYKEFNFRYMKNSASYCMFNFLYFSLAVTVLFVLGSNPPGYHPYTVLLGVMFGVLIVFTNMCYMKAMETGPLSFSALFYSLGLLIPILFGILFWGEMVNLPQIAGLVLLLVTFYLANESNKDYKHRIKLRWILYCLVSFAGNGGLMTLSKQHQVLLPGQETDKFLIVAFSTAALLSSAFFLWYHYIKKQKVHHLQKPYFILIIFAACGSAVFGNLFTLMLAAMIPAIIQFPSVNGGVVILSTAASVFLFREKLPAKGITGLITGISALVLLSMK